MKREIHAFCGLFPECTETEFDALKASINKNGQRDDIVLLGEKILDGRSRYRACVDLNILPRTRQYDPVKDGPSPLRWVEDKNLNRRHLTVGQRAALAARLAEEYEKEAAAQSEEEAAPPTETGPDEKPTVPDPENKVSETDGSEAESTDSESKKRGPKEKALSKAAKDTDTDPRRAREAAKVKAADPELFEKVESGEVTLDAAIKQVKEKAAAKEEKPDQMRKQESDAMRPILGDKFADAVLASTVLKKGELKKFLKLSVQQQKLIAPMISSGWKVDDAVKFQSGTFDQDDRVRELLNYTITRNDLAVIDVDGFVIAIVGPKRLEGETPESAAVAELHKMAEKAKAVKAADTEEAQEEAQAQEEPAAE